jgi:hypothetical protein
MNVKDLTPERLEFIYEIVTGQRERKFPYGMISYDTYINYRYAVEVSIPREKAKGESEYEIR